MIQQAQFFERFITLNRFSTDILSFHNAGHIDWQASWSSLHYDSTLCKSHTSFKQNTALTFAIKLLLDELPLMAVLQIRKPDIYKNDWKCAICNQEKQTWTHLWSCAPLIDKIKKLCDDTKSFFLQELSSHDRAPQNGLSHSFTRIFF